MRAKQTIQAQTTDATLPIERVAIGYYLVLGCLAALVANGIFRLVGQSLLPPGNTVRLLLVYTVSVPLMAGLVYMVYASQNVTADEGPIVAILLALPGMIIDVITTSFFGTIFPNMDPTAANYFGGLLLLAYAVVLLTGFILPSNQ